MASINLYGKLRRDFEKKYDYSGRDIKIKVKSGVEAIRALEANFPGFSTLINRRGGYTFSNGNDIYENPIGPNDLGALSNSNDWHIMPMAHGSSGKSLAMGLIVVGLIIVTIASYGTASPATVPGSAAAMGYGAAASIGMGMALAGLSMLLAPSPPREADSSKDDPSFLFNNGFNNSKTGFPVPLLFGTAFCGSHTVSLGAETENLGGLKSKAVLELVDLISEGEIYGPADGTGSDAIYQSTYMNQTKVKNDAGEFNFDGVTEDLLVGVAGQSFNPELNDAAQRIQSTTSVGVPLNDKGDSTTRSIPEGLTDLKLTVQFPSGLLVIYDSGRHRSRTVSFDITITPTVGSPTVIEKRISDKSYSEARVDIDILDIENSYGTGPWDVKIERTSDAGETSKKASYVDKFSWYSYTEITRVKLEYYKRAAIATVVDAEQFKEPVPSMLYYMRGLKVQVPDNYTPDVENGGGTYDGVWGGDTTSAYTSNAAWIIYEICTNKKWGIGLDPDEVDKFGLYSISQYNDGTIIYTVTSLDEENNVYVSEVRNEPRFTFNAQLANSEQALAFLSHICSTCNCYPVWVDGVLTFIQDRPTTFTRIATPANVTDGIFTYQGTDKRVRHTVITVGWNNPDNFGIRETLIVEDEQGINNYGYNELQLDLVGCYNRFEAIRKARYALYTDLEQTQMLTFTGGSEWSDCVPGEVIKVEDPDWTGVENMGGRIVSSTTTSLETDTPVTIPSGTVTVYIAQTSAEAVERTLTNGVGVTSSLTWANPLSEAPQQDNSWAVSFPDPTLREFKVVSIVENGVADYTVTGIEYNSAKWSYIEDGQVVELPPTTTFDTGSLDPPSNLQLDSYSYIAGDAKNRKYDMSISWSGSPDTRTQQYEIQYTYNDGPRLPLTSVSGVSYIWADVLDGVYDIYVRAISPVANSPWISFPDFTMLGNTGTPQPPTNLRTADGGNEWGGKDCDVIWDSPEDATSLVTVYSPDATSSINVMNENVGKIKSFKVEVYDTDTLTLRRTYITASESEQEYVYLYSMNQEDGAGVPERDLTFKIYSVDWNDQLSTALTRAVSNPIPTMSSAKPTLTSRPAYMRVEWALVDDNDMSHYKVYLDTTADIPIEYRGTVNYTDDLFDVNGLDYGVSYYARVVPYDGFGIGIESQVSDPETVLQIPNINIDAELVDSITITQDAAVFTGTLSDLYNRIWDTGGVSSTNPGTHYIQYAYQIENYFDRVGIWSANANAQVYLALSDDDITYNFYKCASGHVPDADFNMVAATNQADAISFYWQLSAGLNVAYFPNNQTAKHVRLYFVNTNSTQIYEFVPSRLLISELAAIEHLSAISADVGTVVAGYLQSTNLSATTGMEMALNDTEIVLGGYTDRDIVLDGNAPASIEINNLGTLEIADSGKINMGDDTQLNLGDDARMTVGTNGYIRISDNVMLEENSDSIGRIIVSEDTTLLASGKLNLYGKDYTQIDDGGISTFIWDPTYSTHQTYQTLSRVESGTTKHGNWATIPGIFKTEPKVLLSPNVLKSYDNRYKERTQTFKLEVTNMQQYPANSYRWRFIPTAILELESGVFSFNSGQYTQNVDRNWKNNAYLSYSPQIQLAPGVRKVTANVTSWAFTIENQSNYPRAGWAQWYVYLQGYYAGAWSNLNYLGPLGGVKTALGAMNPGPINTVLASVLVGADISWIRLAMQTVAHESRTAGMKTSISGLSPAPYYGAWQRMTLNSYTTEAVNAPQAGQGTINWIAVGS